jgi:hypothetical protein
MAWAGARWWAEEVVLHLIRWDEGVPCLPPSKAGDPVRVTVVGGAEEIRRSLSLPMCAGEEAVLKAIERLAESQPVKNGRDAQFNFYPPSRFKSFRCISPEQYAAEVGEVQAALETRLDPYTCTGASATYVP